MSQFKLGPYAKHFTRDEINAAKSANAIEAARGAAGEQARRMAILKKDLDQYILIYLDEWVNQTNLAITRAVPPVDKRSHRSWFIALLGNLIWAGTVFVPGGVAAKAVIAVMSLAGATVGTATITEFENRASQPQDPKELVTAAVNQRHAALETFFTSKSQDWAWELDARAQAANDGVSSEAMKTYAWTKMFPLIPYQSRMDRIYKTTKDNMEGMLADYNRQWQDWIAREGLESFDGTETWWKIAMNMHPFVADLRKHWAKFGLAAKATP